MGTVFGREEEKHERNDGGNSRSPVAEAYPWREDFSRSRLLSLSSLSENKPPISAAPSARSPEKTQASCDTGDRMRSSSKATSLSEEKPPILTEPSQRFVEKPGKTSPPSIFSPSPPAPPWMTSPSPFPSSWSVTDTGDRMRSSSTITSFSEKKPPMLAESSKRFVEKPGETSPPLIFSPSPSPPLSKSSPSPPASSLKISPSLFLSSCSAADTGDRMKSSSTKIVNVRQFPTPSPFKHPQPDERFPEPLKIEQRSRYEIPKQLKELIEKDMVPIVLRRPLSPSAYADYFATLLYAENFYLEKWGNYLLSEVKLEFWHDVVFQTQNSREGKDFIAFEIDSASGRRPYLLSRDFVYVQPSGKEAGPFKGILFRVVKSTTVLVEFGDDFYKQHSPIKKYDVSFSFNNRVCLKWLHEAVLAASDPLLLRILFPNPSSSSSSLYLPSSRVPASRSSSHGWLHVVDRILNLRGPLPYLIEGPLSETREGALSSTGAIIQEAVLQIYRTRAHCRILVCAPRNRTCDALMEKWMLEIPESELFRANAASRSYHLVPDDIIPACLFKGESFTCPPLSDLQQFKVITSTFMSSFRLHAAGIEANHFTHIFLVDASSTTEPETIVALAHLVSNKTVIVITGSSNDIPTWVRSDIARRNGLKQSLFQRLLQMEPYSRKDPIFMTHIV